MPLACGIVGRMTACEVCGGPCNSKYSVCRENEECRREYQRRVQRKYVDANRDAVLERAKKGRAADPERFRERSRAKRAKKSAERKAQRQAHLDELLELAEEYHRGKQEESTVRAEAARQRDREGRRRRRQKNPEQDRESVRRWKKANPEKVAATAKRHRQKNAEKISAQKKGLYRANREQFLERNDASRAAMHSTVQGTARLLFLGVRARARKRGLPFDLTAEWVESELALALENGCPLLGIEITLGTGPRSPSVPSIDRFRPELGYVQANCWILSFAANNMKHDMTIDFIRKVAALADTRFKGVA